MKFMTFFSRFEADILADRKTITLRDHSESDFQAGDRVRVSRNEDGVYFCDIQVLAVQPVKLSELNDDHAHQENMSLPQLQATIADIYPGITDLFMIKFVRL